MSDQTAIDPPRLVPAGVLAAAGQPGAHHSGAEPEVLIGHVERLLRAKRPAAARPLLQALKRLAAPTPHVGELEAQLLLDEAQPLAALGVLDATIAAAPVPAGADYAGAYLLRAQIHIGRANLPAALADTAEAVMLDRSAPEPKLRLGVLLVELGRFEEAIACLRESLAARPRTDAFRALAMAYDRAGRADEAASCLAEATRRWPKDRELRAAGVQFAMRRRDYAGAVEQAAAARRDGAIDADIFGLWGHACASLGRHEAAAEAYRDALKFAPEDRYIEQAAALSQAAARGGDRVPPERVRALFDLSAAGFDAHLLGLGYRVPGLIRRALTREAAGARETLGPVLDLGCGTGLTAIAIADLAGPITGFDISPAMLQEARARRVFADLHEGDLPVLLAAADRSWPVITAGDVLICFGALDTVFRGVRARLAPGGRFIFSIAALCPDADGVIPGHGAWLQQRGGRHAHSRSYVEHALAEAGLALLSIEAETLRHEADVAVPGWIIVATHPCQEISR